MIEINNQTTGTIDISRLKSIAEKFYARYRIRHRQLSVALVGDATIKRLNKRYLGKDDITDVLAFPGEADFFGEIVIDLPQVKRQAKRFGHSPEAELIYVLVHGLLHLLGHDDSTDAAKKEMDRLTDKFIRDIESADLNIT